MHSRPAASNEAYMTGYDPQGNTLNKELVELVESMDGLESVGHLYSHETKLALNEKTVENIRDFYTKEMLTSWASYDAAGVPSQV